MGGLLLLARALLPPVVGASGRAAWVLYSGLALFAALTMGGNGVQPADVVGGLRASAWLRLGAWSAWVAVTLPVARASLLVPTTYWLRSLPVARTSFWIVHGLVLVVCVESPMVALMGAGGGLTAGMAAGLAPAAAHALLVPWPMRAREVVAGFALLAAVASGRDAIVIAVGLVAGTVGVAAVVRRAPELTHVHRRARVFGGAALALASAHVATLWRRERGTLARGALLALLGGAAAVFGIRNNGVRSSATAWRVLLAVGGASLPLASVGVAVAAWHTERRHRWLLDATGTGARTRVVATAGVALAWGAALGALQAGLATALVAPLHGSIVVLVHIAWGAALAALVAAAVRRGVRDDRRDGERTFVVVVALAVLAATGAALATVAALALAALLGASLLATQATRGLVPPDLPPAPVEELT
jgi:hypothetical protein